MVLFYLVSRDLKKIEGLEFTLRAQKNRQDSVRINQCADSMMVRRFSLHKQTGYI
jgi:hypothetical protein